MSRASTPTSTMPATVGKARLTCYAALDKTIMTKVIPWVTYLGGVREPEEHERHAVELRPVQRCHGIRHVAREVIMNHCGGRPRPARGAHRLLSMLTYLDDVSSGQWPCCSRSLRSRSRSSTAPAGGSGAALRGLSSPLPRAFALVRHQPGARSALVRRVRQVLVKAHPFAGRQVRLARSRLLLRLEHSDRVQIVERPRERCH